MAKNEAVDTETQDSGDAPLIDLNDASIKKMIARAKKRGFITIDELNEALPQDQMSSEQIEDIMSAINDMGINVVETEEAGEEEEGKGEDDEPEATDIAEASPSVPAAPWVRRTALPSATSTAGSRVRAGVDAKSFMSSFARHRCGAIPHPNAGTRTEISPLATGVQTGARARAALITAR